MGTVKYINLDDVEKWGAQTSAYEVQDVGMFELKRITHGEVREITAQWVSEDGSIADFPGFLDNMVLRGCVTPKFTQLTLDRYDRRAVRTLGQHIGYACGILNLPPEQDRPKVEAPAVPPSSAS